MSPEPKRSPEKPGNYLNIINILCMVGVSLPLKMPPSWMPLVVYKFYKQNQHDELRETIFWVQLLTYVNKSATRVIDICQ